MFSFHHGKTSFYPYFSFFHHIPIFRCSNTFMSTVECWITTAGQNSAPYTGLIKATLSLRTTLTGISLHLITAKILSSRLIAIQAMERKTLPHWAEKAILLRKILKSEFGWRVGKLNRRDKACNTEQLQASVYSSSIIAAIQYDPPHGKIEGFLLTFQMP